jgi:hypothetical protein
MVKIKTINYIPILAKLAVIIIVANKIFKAIIVVIIVIVICGIPRIIAIFILFRFLSKLRCFSYVKGTQRFCIKKLF